VNAEESRKEMAAALGRVPSGLFVLTVRNGARETGMLTSWVQQCSFEPLQISLALKQGRDVLAWLADGAAFTLNILDDSQTDMLVHFGRGFALGEPAFEGLAVERPGGAAPVLCEALAYLECRVAGRFPVADHELLVGQVVGGRVLNAGHPMVHVRKNGTHY
jgi:flavin reductase (DIM6/NTAB) family NADH-FMN oxidoreductase RutF